MPMNYPSAGEQAVEDILREGVPEVDTEQISNEFYCSSFGSDGQAIQDAINAKPSGQWAKIIVDGIDNPPYLVSSPISIPSKTVIEIQEDVKLADGADDNIFENENFEDDATDDNDIHIIGKGGIIDGNKANQSQPSKPHGDGFYVCGVSILGASRVSVRDIQIKDTFNHGVNLSAVDHGTVKGCVAEDLDNALGHSHFRMTDDTKNTFIEFTDNIAISCGYPFYVEGTEYSIVSNNLVNDYTGSCAIGVSDGEGLGTKVVEISGNVIYYTGDTNGIIDVHTFSTARGTNGTEDVCVEGNILYNTGTKVHGIYLNSTDSTNVEKVSISGNVLRGCNIRTSGDADGGAPKYVSISGNKLYGAPIFLHDISKSAVSSNVVYGSKILVEPGDAGVTPDEVSIVGNTIEPDGYADYGVQIDGSRGAVISGNSIVSAGTYGIYVMSGCSDINVNSNSIRASGTGKYDDAGTRTVIDGLGKNGANDPASAGDWNGNGREGVKVKWNDGTNYYISTYLGGTWYDVQVDSPVV